MNNKTTTFNFYHKSFSNTLNIIVHGGNAGIEDPFLQKIRYLDKLIDELVRGKKMESILRK